MPHLRSREVKIRRVYTPVAFKVLRSLTFTEIMQTHLSAHWVLSMYVYMYEMFSYRAHGLSVKLKPYLCSHSSPFG